MDGSKSNPNDQQFISFQDYSPINRSGQALIDIAIPLEQPATYPTAPPSENLQAAPEESTGTSSPSFWTIEYYQKYFNVTTTDVLERIKHSMYPFGTDNYLISHIRPNPDLYGPFWICITLIFAIAISGNMANYFQTANSGKFHWKYDFHLVSIAATCIFLYAWLLPLTIWGANKWTSSQQTNNPEELIQSNNSLGLLEIICVYGYSLALYVPIAFLLTVQITWLQWFLVIASACLSGGILLRSLSPSFSGKNKIIFMAVILSMHFLLASSFMLYFFHNSNSAATPAVTESPAKIIMTTLPGTVAPKLNQTSLKTR